MFQLFSYEWRNPVLIKKEFHFYAAHRNHKLTDKCFSLHGHRYGVSIFYGAKRTNDNVTIPFSAFSVAENYFVKKWDHAHIIDKADPLLPYLQQFIEGDLHEVENGPHQKLVILDRPASVENMCFEIFHDMVKLGYPIILLEIKETDSSTVCYDGEDYENDLIFFKVAPHTPEHECDFTNSKRCPICGKTPYEWRVEQRRKQAASGTGTDDQ